MGIMAYGYIQGKRLGLIGVALTRNFLLPQDRHILARHGYGLLPGKVG